VGGTLIGTKRYGGHRVETYLGSTLAAAHRRYAELLSEEHAPVSTVEELLRRYLVVEVPKKAKATQEMAERAITKLLPVFGKLELTHVTPAMLYEYHSRRTAKTAARHELGVLRHAFSCAVAWGTLPSNPLLGQVRLPKGKPRRRYVSDDELRAFLKIAGTWLSAYVHLKLLTGLPKEDMLSLRREDVREDGLHARRRKTDSKPKVYAWDKAKHLERALEDVSEAHRGRVGSAYLFHTRDGKPYYQLDADGHRAKKPSAFDSLWQFAMKKFVAAGGARFTEHDLRAKVASDVEAAHAQQLMDHTTAQMTERVYRRAPKRVSIGRKMKP
jgi:integrase